VPASRPSRPPAAPHKLLLLLSHPRSHTVGYIRGSFARNNASRQANRRPRSDPDQYDTLSVGDGMSVISRRARPLGCWLLSAGAETLRYDDAYLPGRVPTDHYVRHRLPLLHRYSQCGPRALPRTRSLDRHKRDSLESGQQACPNHIERAVAAVVTSETARAQSTGARQSLATRQPAQTTRVTAREQRLGREGTLGPPNTAHAARHMQWIDTYAISRHGFPCLPFSTDDTAHAQQ